MIVETLYLSDEEALERVTYVTGLDADEIIMLVGGRYSKGSRWAGKVKGKMEVSTSGKVYLRKNFGSKTLWSGDHDLYFEVY